MTEILIVDDEFGIRNILSEILIDNNYRIATAASADEARKLVAERHFDLVLLDIWMPGTDGLTLLREWKYAGTLNFPVVIMSGHGSIEQANQAIEDGAMEFIEKPISLRILLDSIQRSLAKWAQRQRARAVEDQQQPKRGRKRRADIPRERMPVFEIKEYGLKLDYNRPFRDVLFEFERSYFRTVLMHIHQSMADLARHAGMERTHLYRKIRALGLDVDELRREARARAHEMTDATAKPTPPEKVQLVEPVGSGARSAPSTTTPRLRIGTKSSDPQLSNAIDFPTGSTLDPIYEPEDAK